MLSLSFWVLVKRCLFIFVVNVFESSLILEVLGIERLKMVFFSILFFIFKELMVFFDGVLKDLFKYLFWGSLKNFLILVIYLW